MKTELIIQNETRFVAYKCLDECNLTERYLLKLFHQLLLPPEDCTKDMVANVATILMGDWTDASQWLTFPRGKNFSDTYLKYAN